ncbi:diacylglycerol/lipid kinase family protein [Actinoplanes regularis]|uniref:Diacylglycerol kinase family enzyme n=1 Tax=Actinoplanes regularis TaxID=52697 RepID=A0A238W7A7_9ACTN|nr:diacylglycerol kinase family protein [Actinoplanes regularis]GIE85206.1 hypothetical protein Are01nite_16860 [Actinoplanes regularis]SNR42291.1 Diacylglycerol kinase family enzyme [Actinoplanes regularis]
MRSKQQLTEDIRRERRAALVVNTRSRRGREFYEDARRRLLTAGFQLLADHALEQSGELEPLLADALDKGPDLLIAGGGDGTISTAGRMLAHRDVALGLLPLGTTNNFARTVRVEPDLDAALTTLIDGKVIDVDLGLAGDTPFTNHVGVGLSAAVMTSAPPRLKRLAGRLAYPITALGLLARHRPLRAMIRAEGHELEFHTHQLYVANGGFHAGRPITADAHADDRLLVARTPWVARPGVSCCARQPATPPRVTAARCVNARSSRSANSGWRPTGRPRSRSTANPAAPPRCGSPSTPTPCA